MRIKFICYFAILGLLIFQVDAMDINDFFPDINGNLTKVTWAHAVNNKTHLANALNSSVMMLEADVIYGKINGSGQSIPIMGHPPATESDLSLEEFLNTVDKYNKNQKGHKGVKLDFKSIEVFLKSIAIIDQLYSSINYPIWINADIIAGPLHPTTTPVNASEFLKKAKKFDKSILSLGWTTTKPNATTVYTDEQINSMIQSIKDNDVSQNITFAIRAGIAAESFEQMNTLKSKVKDCTITIWSSEGDEVNVSKLRDLIFEYGVERVYIDVPKDLYDQLDLGNNTGSSGFSSFVLLSSLMALSLL